MTIVLIPAKAPSIRWKCSYPKHLAQIGGESILHRLIRQCQERGVIPQVWTPTYTIASHVRMLAGVHRPLKYRWLAETLKHTRTSWQGRVMVLLGDVIFHPRLLDYLWDRSEPLQFYGTSAEIFALVFDPGAYGIVQRAIHTALSYAEAYPEDGGAGKLWSVYKAVVNWPQAHEIDFIDQYFTFVQDEYTTDIDTVEQYETFLRDVVEPGLLEEVTA